MISWVTPGGSLPLTAFAASPRASTPLTKSSAAGLAIPLTSVDRAGPRVAGRARLRALAFFARFFMAVCYTGWFPTATGSFTTPGRSRSRTSAERARSPRPGARAHGSCGRTGGRRASRHAPARPGRQDPAPPQGALQRVPIAAPEELGVGLDEMRGDLAPVIRHDRRGGDRVDQQPAGVETHLEEVRLGR